jgi:hypothetical protein
VVTSLQPWREVAMPHICSLFLSWAGKEGLSRAAGGLASKERGNDCLRGLGQHERRLQQVLGWLDLVT